MTDLRDQIEWEKASIGLGVSRFRNQQNKAMERGAYTETFGGRKLLKNYLAKVSEGIVHACAPNPQKKHKEFVLIQRVLSKIDPDVLAMCTLHVVIGGVFTQEYLASLCMRLGGMVEDDLKFSKFKAELPDYFTALQRDLDNRNSTSYRHRHRVLTHRMNEKGVQWIPFDPQLKTKIGLTLIRIAEEHGGFFKLSSMRVKGKAQPVKIIEINPEVLDWITGSTDSTATLLPDRLPCIVEPDPWIDPFTGGYYNSRLRMTTPLVKTRAGLTGDQHKKLLIEADMPQVYRAVNGLQATKWAINTRVLEVIQAVWDKNLNVGMPQSQPYEIPKCPVEQKESYTEDEQEAIDLWKQEARELHAMERHRQGEVLGVVRTMRLGSMLKSQELLHYVYQLDFRSRTYAATSGVSPQGNDHAKAVLQFAEARPLGPRGLYWLKVHGANKWGEDKSPYDARVAWIEERHEQWLAVADDPIGNRAYWKDADKPYQFLAFCFEYAEAAKVGASFRSRLPIALDGSCNGLQHFSAMLRDAVGGKAVNLTPSEKPADIYQEVADVCTKKLHELAADASDPMHAAARNWIDLFKSMGYDRMPRKVSKKPVMTLPYGSTQNACTSSIYQWYVQSGCTFLPKDTVFRHCIFLSQLLWNSIGDVVIAARAAMAWIQKCSSVLSAQEQPIHYVNPLGFPLYQASRKEHSKQIWHTTGGRMNLRVFYTSEELDPRKQRQGSSPNLVHNVDACHMMLCVNAGLDMGITDFAMIHDDFGVHACFVDDWHRIIREQFLYLHGEHDILRDFKDQHEARTGLVLPDLPSRGSLDLSSVIDSPFFFG